NGVPARFERRGAHVTGSVVLGNQPMQLDGGFDGRAYRFNWIRGNDYGYVLMSVSPDGRHFSGVEWHEEPIPLFHETTWFGERAGCGGSVAFDRLTAEKFLRRAGRFSLFGLQFGEDGAVDRDNSADSLRWLAAETTRADVQLVAHEFRRENAALNRAFAERALQSIRAELERAGANVARTTYVAKGSDSPRQRPDTGAVRALYSAVDVEIRR
ncbi:MAG: hypothetical protein QOE68_3880, partial [Thermoanaerobaculia bacterium]|nr:hypothetical protein [Thermoanaerobaculia bacterium]